MAKTFFYKAKNANGQMLTGSLLADNEKAAALYIQGKGHFVLQIKEQSSANNLLDGMLKSWHSVRIKDIAVICRQLSTMIDAGLPLVSCLAVTIDQTTNSRLRTALQNVYKEVKEGQSFSRALADNPGIFPVVMVNMVEAGEIGGVLDEVLARLAAHFEKEYKLNEKIKSALAYPMVVMAMAVMAVSFIITFVLPSFVSLFVSMKVELPWETRLLLTVSKVFAEDWSVLLLVGVLLGIGVKLTCARTGMRKVWERMILAVPVVGTLAHKAAIARFCRILSTLLRGGVSLIIALDVVKKVIDNQIMMESITSAQQRVKEGVALAVTLADSQVFTPMVIQMVAIGEESGTVDKMLEKVADFYESEVDDMVTRLSSIIEPVIVGVLGIVIGFIVIAVVLPLFDAIANVGAGI